MSARVFIVASCHEDLKKVDVEQKARADVIVILEGDHFTVVKHRTMFTHGGNPLRFHESALAAVLMR